MEISKNNCFFYPPQPKFTILISSFCLVRGRFCKSEALSSLANFSFSCSALQDFCAEANCFSWKLLSYDEWLGPNLVSKVYMLMIFFHLCDLFVLDMSMSLLIFKPSKPTGQNHQMCKKHRKNPCPALSSASHGFVFLPSLVLPGPSPSDQKQSVCFPSRRTTLDWGNSFHLIYSLVLCLCKYMYTYIYIHYIV